MMLGWIRFGGIGKTWEGRDMGRGGDGILHVRK